MSDNQIREYLFKYLSNNQNARYGLVLGRFPRDNITALQIDREKLGYFADGVATMTFMRHSEPIFQAVLFEDCDITWLML